MAREKVMKISCDRCNRQELQPVIADKVGADFEASFNGQRLLYQDLCLRCKETIKNIWTALEEYDREIKYTVLKNAPVSKNGPVVPENQAAPVSAAPNYSPPQPHSQAAGKR